MPNGYWVPFDYKTGNQHKCKSNTKPKTKKTTNTTATAEPISTLNKKNRPNYINLDSEYTILPLIRSAITNNDNLKITYYTTSRNAWSDREITPYNLYSNSDGIYIDAYCYLRQEQRTFRLDKIKYAETVIKNESNNHGSSNSDLSSSNSQQTIGSSLKWEQIIIALIIVGFLYLAYG